jgi:hypothetical protein
MEGRVGTRPGPPLSVSPLPARCRPCDLASADPQSPVAKTETLQHASKAAAHGVARRTSPGPPHRRATGRPRPRPSGLYKAPPSTRSNSPHSQLAPRQPRFSPLALVRSSLQRRRATGRRQRLRVGPPLDEQTPGSGGGALPESFPPIAVKPCFLYAPRCRRRLPRRAQVSSSPSQRTRHRCAVGLESNGSIPIRVT